MSGIGSISSRDLAPYREYHARRERRRLERREALRQDCLRATKAGIRRLAPEFAAIRALYLFGSLLQVGRFTEHSDIDVAIECDDLETEGRFRRALEEDLRRNVDLRLHEGGVAWAVEAYGECVYEREVPAPP
jgi:predicted nucleotidyltransferase